MAKSIMKYRTTNGDTGSHSQKKKKVSFGKCVMVKEIPFYNEEEMRRVFYTDQEYDLFEVAEQQRLLGIRLLLEEYKLQRRMLTLQCLMDAERTAMLPSVVDANTTTVSTKTTTSMGRKRDSSKMTVSSNQEQREVNDDDCSDCVLSTSTLNRLAKRRRTSMMKLSAYAA